MLKQALKRQQRFVLHILQCLLIPLLAGKLSNGILVIRHPVLIILQILLIPHIFMQTRVPIL